MLFFKKRAARVIKRRVEKDLVEQAIKEKRKRINEEGLLVKNIFEECPDDQLTQSKACDDHIADEFGNNYNEPLHGEDEINPLCEASTNITQYCDAQTSTDELDYLIK